MGHKTEMEIDSSATVIGNVTQTNYADCETYSDGGNSININGDNDVISGVDQKISYNVDTTCLTKDPLNYSFSSRVQNDVVAELADEQIALTQWMDNSKDTLVTGISSDLELGITQENSQNCMNTLNATNTINVTGDNDVVKDVVQKYSLDTVTTCHMQDGVAFKATSSMSDKINQHMVYTSVNPFAFITDAIAAVTKSIALLIAFCFIVVICFLALFALLHHRSKNRRADRRAAEAAAAGRQ